MSKQGQIYKHLFFCQKEAILSLSAFKYFLHDTHQNIHQLPKIWHNFKYQQVILFL